MSDVRWWTDGFDVHLDEWGGCTTLFIGEEYVVLAPDECDSLAAALVQAAARKRSEDEAKKLEAGR